MLVHYSKILSALFLSTTLLAGCAGGITPKDPCAEANRPVSYQHLFDNSILQTYELCLRELRKDALLALE